MTRIICIRNVSIVLFFSLGTIFLRADRGVYKIPLAILKTQKSWLASRKIKIDNAEITLIKRIGEPSSIGEIYAVRYKPSDKPEMKSP